MQRETTHLPTNIVLHSFDYEHNMSCSCVEPQGIMQSVSQTLQTGSPDARSMSETSSGFVSSSSSGTAGCGEHLNLQPCMNSKAGDICACTQSGSAESINALIEAMRSHRSEGDSSSLQSLELAAGGSANWSTSSSSTASKSRMGLHERYGDDLRRANFAARVIQQAYRTHRLKRTFTRRCNEKRLSARLSSSCFELDATNDALSYFGTDREALCTTASREAKAVRTFLPPVQRAQADSTCKLSDSSSHVIVTGMNQATSSVTSGQESVSVSVSSSGIAFGHEADDENENENDVDEDEDEEDEDEFVRECTLQRVEAQPTTVGMQLQLANSAKVAVAPAMNANRPTCACCECAYSFERMQLAAAQTSQIQVHMTPQKPGGLLVAYPSNGSVNAHPQTILVHPHAHNLNANGNALRRQLEANVPTGANVINGQLVAPRAYPTMYPVQTSASAVGVCSCQQCVAGAANSHESAIYASQFAQNQLYANSAYAMALVHTNNQHPHPHQHQHQQIASNARTGAGTGTGARCPHCAVNQFHVHTHNSQGANGNGSLPQNAANHSSSQAQAQQSRQAACARVQLHHQHQHHAGAVPHPHPHPNSSSHPQQDTSKQIHGKPTASVSRAGHACSCEHCQYAAPNSQHHQHPHPHPENKANAKPKSTVVSCVPFFLSNVEQKQSAVDGPYEASPASRTRRSEVISQALGVGAGSSSRAGSSCACGSANCAAQARHAQAVVASHGHGHGHGNVAVPQPSAAELRHRRHYRVALNLFNRKPELGVRFLIEAGFVKADDPAGLASFLLRKRGFSRQAISEYLGSRPKQPKPTSTSTATASSEPPALLERVLEYYANGIDMRRLEVLAALRKFQQYVRFCGEAQRIERFAEAFAAAYSRQNAVFVSSAFRGGADSVLLLAYAIVMLNTDLHNSNVRADRKMKPEEFVRNLSGVDAGGDFDKQMLNSIYDQVRATPLQPAVDHVAQVQKLENCIVSQRHVASSGKPKSKAAERRPELHLAVPERRLVCYCRLYKAIVRRDEKEQRDEAERQRDVFLLNDLLLVAKERKRRAGDKKRDAKLARRNSQPQPIAAVSATGAAAGANNENGTHALGYLDLCDAYPLIGMQVSAFDSPPHCQLGIRVVAFCNDRRHAEKEKEKDKEKMSANSASAKDSSSSASSGVSSEPQSSHSVNTTTRVTLLFYARSSHDRTQFLNDLQETILEATETEYIWNRYKMAGH